MSLVRPIVARLSARQMECVNMTGRPASSFGFLAAGVLLLGTPACIQPGTGGNAASDRTTIDPLARVSLQSINDCPYAAREQLLADIEVRLRLSSCLLQQLGERLSRDRRNAHWSFQSAQAEVRRREGDVRKSIVQVRQASPENWNEVRSILALNFLIHSAALARAVEVASG